MKKVDIVDVLLDDKNFQTAQAVWECLNGARERSQRQFWERIAEVLEHRMPRGWSVDSKEAEKSAPWYHLDLTPARTGDTYCCIRLQQTRETEEWRLQWGVGMASADGQTPRLPSRGIAKGRLEQLRSFLESRNFQPSRGKRSWWVAKRFRDERLGRWSIIQALAVDDEIEQRIASDLLQLWDQTRLKIVALNREL